MRPWSSPLIRCNLATPCDPFVTEIVANFLSLSERSDLTKTFEQGSGIPTTRPSPSTDTYPLPIPIPIDKGHYLYAEASSPAEEDDTAVLESREFQPVSIRCLSFWYHMLGEDMGSLEVFLRDEKTGSNTPVWVRSGDQGPEWKQANVTYISTNMHRVGDL